MTRTISQRELRNQSGEIMRALDRGEDFIVTSNGRPVGELRPIPRRSVSGAALAAAMKDAPPIDYEKFRADLDQFMDQSIEPRA